MVLLGEMPSAWKTVEATSGSGTGWAHRRHRSATDQPLTVDFFFRLAGESEVCENVAIRIVRRQRFKLVILVIGKAKQFEVQ
jgi:hypothetical protein